MQHYFFVIPTKPSPWMMLLGNYQTLVTTPLKQVEAWPPPVPPDPVHGRPAAPLPRWGWGRQGRWGEGRRVGAVTAAGAGIIVVAVAGGRGGGGQQCRKGPGQGQGCPSRVGMPQGKDRYERRGRGRGRGTGRGRDALEGRVVPPPPFPIPPQGAQPVPSHYLPDGKCRLQWHLQPTVTAPNRCGNLLQPPV